MKKLPLILIFILAFFILISKIGSIKLLAQEEVSEEDFELITPKNSVFCTDFDIKKSKTDSFSEKIETGDQNIVQGATNEVRDDEGKIWLDNLEQPDFSLMENRLNSTLPKLLPGSLNESLDIDRTSLETKTKHFISGKEIYEKQAEEDIPYARIELPEWWTAVLGESKIFCGLFQSCKAPEKLAIKIEPADLEELAITLNDEEPTECEKSEPVAAKRPEIVDDERPFKTKSLFSIIKEVFYDIIDSFNSLKTTTTTEETTLENKTRGYLIGGKTLAEQSTFFSSFLPSDINSSIKDSSLSGPSVYGLDPEHSIVDEEDSKKISFQEQNQVRGRYCLQLCSLYPSDPKFDISTIDPICISCNPKDYQN